MPLGKARVATEGKDVTVIAWGSMLHRVLQSVEGFDAEVIDPMTLNPFDEETIYRSVRKTGRVVIVPEAQKTCGFGAELSASIAEEAMLSFRGPIMRVAGYDAVIPLPNIEDFYVPTVERIQGAIREVLRY